MTRSRIHPGTPHVTVMPHKTTVSYGHVGSGRSLLIDIGPFAISPGSSDPQDSKVYARAGCRSHSHTSIRGALAPFVHAMESQVIPEEWIEAVLEDIGTEVERSPSIEDMTLMIMEHLADHDELPDWWFADGVVPASPFTTLINRWRLDVLDGISAVSDLAMWALSDRILHDYDYASSYWTALLPDVSGIYATCHADAQERARADRPELILDGFACWRARTPDGIASIYTNPDGQWLERITYWTNT